MKIDLSKVSYDGQWCDFGEARLKIRPWPASHDDIAYKDGAVIFAGSHGLEMFQYCLEDWDGVIGADDKPLKLTPQIKKDVFNFQLGKAGEPGKEETMSAFVIRIARKMTADIGADVKN